MIVQPPDTQDDGPWDVISRYTRAQAIKDGVLVDVSEWAAREGFRIPVAMTATLYGDAIRTPGGMPLPAGVKVVAESAVRWLLKRLHLLIAGQDPQGSRMLGDDRLHGELGPIKFWAVCDGGDDGKAVLTVMLEGED
ncbi:MAG: hypothetical protein IMZ65_00225 [Planctomycetes bacterium]|nr:hypothetical protein [Planctomycetota bacterium]